MRDGRSSSASSHSGRGDQNSVPNRSSSIRTPKRQRPTPSNSLEDKQLELACPVCLDIIDEAHITKCGHTFCYACIVRSIDMLQSCPRCNAPLTMDQIFPNFLLNELVVKYKLRRNCLDAIGSVEQDGADGLRNFVASESGNLTLTDVNVMLEVLTQRKQLLEAESCAAQNKLLLEFLKHLRQKKNDEKQQITKELTLIEEDIEEVENKLKEVHSKCPTLEDVERTVASAASLTEGNENVTAMRQEMMDLIGNIGSTVAVTGTTTPTALAAAQQPSHEISAPKIENKLSSLATRRRRMHAHFDDFVQCYFQSRGKDLYFPQENRIEEPRQHGGLDEFREDLVKFSRYSSVRAIATIQFASDVFNNSTIVSSIEFDKDNEYLAIAGVTKRIKIFEYGTVARDVVNIHYPCIEMVSNSKISSVSWNSYNKNTLASSDYEGTVTIWDVGTGQRTKTYHEHEKRCWSVDFSESDPRLVASGSDDARVKLYNMNVDHSVATLEARANICCVKFNPKSSFHLAFGSADHCVHYYDLRNLKEALCLFKGHKKAVSYVKFLNGEHIVSASTDSQLRMWNVNAPYCLRSFLGHVNEKNFVGLATDGDYIACGSENNALYVYYKGLTKKLFKYKFDGPRGILEEEERREDDPNEFVSAVCWKPNSNILLAANSQGTINVLELV